MSWTGWNSTHFKLWAELGLPDGSVVVLDVVRANFNFYLNTIPTCELTLAMGRNVYTGWAAQIHYVVDTLKMMLPVAVKMFVVEYANAYGPNPLIQWPDDAFIVFEGLLQSTGFEVSKQSGAGFTVSCVHTLANLSFSSTMSSDLTPDAASSFSSPAGLKKGAGTGHFLGNTLALKHCTQDNLEDDLWGLTLLPWLTEIAESKPVYENLVPPAGVDAEADQNDLALDALRRFEPFFSGGTYPYAVKLPLSNLEMTGLAEFQKSLTSFISHETLHQAAGTTFWDKICGGNGYCTTFLAMVVPMAQSAMVVPRVPSLSFPYTTIYASEYEQIGMKSQLARPVRAVTVFTGGGSQAGAMPGQQGQAQAMKNVGGYYENPNIPRGMVQFVRAPSWVADLAPSDAWAESSVNPNGGSGRMDAPGHGPQAVNQPVAVRNLGQSLWDEYARALYICEVLKGRGGNLTGRLRFDIAPGSTVNIQCMEEQFVAAQVGVLGYNIYAFVNGVTISLDAETMRGETRFELAHIRNEFENRDLSTASPIHPLFSTVWPGGPLVAHPAFFAAPAVAGAGVAAAEAAAAAAAGG